MTTSGVDISKTNIFERFTTMRNTVNGSVVWYNGSHPFNTGASNDYGSNLPAQGSQSGEATGNLGQAALVNDSLITASTIVNQYRAFSVLLSRIRRCRLVRHYNDNGSDVIQFDETQVTSTGRDDFSRGNFNDVGTSIASQSVVTASTIDSFVVDLENTLTSHRNSTLTFNEYYCHSSCHSNCHGSGL